MWDGIIREYIKQHRCNPDWMRVIETAHPTEHFKISEICIVLKVEIRKEKKFEKPLDKIKKV